MDINKKWHRPFHPSIPVGLGYGEIGRKKWKNGFHAGDDFLAPYGERIEAAEDGVVGFAADGGDGFGKYVRIQHKDGFKTYYTHMSAFLVKAGEQVKKGHVLGLSGNSGNVWHNGKPVTEEERKMGLGSHCHFEVRDEYNRPIRPIYEDTGMA